MNNLIAAAYLKNKKIDVEQKLNTISNIIRSSQQEATYQKVLLEQNQYHITNSRIVYKSTS